MLQVIDVEKKALNYVITFPPDGVFFVRSNIEIASLQRVNFRYDSISVCSLCLLSSVSHLHFFKELKLAFEIISWKNHYHLCFCAFEDRMLVCYASFAGRAVSYAIIREILTLFNCFYESDSIGE